jgi:hypothetical protein
MARNRWQLQLEVLAQGAPRSRRQRKSARTRVRPQLLHLEDRLAPATFTFSNTAAISIPDSGSATPYPSTITVSGLTDNIQDLNVRLNGFQHTWPSDVDVVLVGPTGAGTFVMGGPGGSDAVSGLILEFDDEAPGPIPASGPLVSGSYQCADYFGDSLPPPAPSPSPSNTLLSIYDGTDGNGTWSLFVFDAVGGDMGTIANGWDLIITIPDTPPPPPNTPPTISDITNQTTNEDTATGAIAFTVDDQETHPAVLAVTATSSNTALVPNGNIVISGGGLLTNTVSWWRAEGNVLDGVGANNGALVNGATYGAGKFGQGFSFDGVDDLVQATSTGMPTGGSNRTLVLWAQLDTLPAAEAFLAGYGGFGTNNQSYHLGVLNDGRVFFSQWGGALTGPVLNTGQWYHIAVRNIGPSVTLFVNGANVGSQFMSINTPAASPFYMGRIPGTLGDTRVLDGSVDEVSVYSRALTTAEIQSLYNSTSTGIDRTVTVTPAANQSGTATITVTVTDGGSLTATDTFDVIVNAVNDPPVITPAAAQSATEDTNKAITGISVADIDAASSSVSVTLGVTRGTLTVSTTVPGGLTAGNITGNGSASVTLTGTISAINTTLAAATGLTYLPQSNYSGPDTVSIQMNDNGNTGIGGPLSDNDSVPVQVAAVADAPVVTASDTSGVEGGTAPLNITVALTDTDGSEVISSVVIGNVPQFATLSAGTNNGDGTWTLSPLDLPGLIFTPPDDGTFTLTVTATSRETSNGSTATDMGSFQAVFTNLAPSLAVFAPTNAVRGQRIPFTLAPDDPSPLDQANYFRYEIDWDANGSIDETVIGLSGIIVYHVYTATGTPTMRVTATDVDDGTSSPATQHTVTVGIVGIVTDPIDPTKTALAVGGTLSSDVITFKPGATPGSVIPTLNGVAQGTFVPTARLLAFGQNGNDTIKSNSKILLPVWFDGGLGNDILTGGPNNDILQGQAGNDTMKGGNGLDLMLGGPGADIMKGGGGGDLMIAAITSYDANDAALSGILQEWTSPRSYNDRLQNLTGPTDAASPDRLNGTFFLVPIVSLQDDAAADSLAGQGDVDLFFAKLALGADTIKDKALSEVVAS